MNRLTTLIAAGAIAGAAATVTLPAQAQEYYVVHNGQVTREFSGQNRLYGRSYISFTFGVPGFWYRDSYRDHYHYRRDREWHERWQRDHWRHTYLDRDHRHSRRGFDDD